MNAAGITVTTDSGRVLIWGPAAMNPFADLSLEEAEALLSELERVVFDLRWVR